MILNKSLEAFLIVFIEPCLHPENNQTDRLKFVRSWETHPDPKVEERFLYEVFPSFSDNEYAIQLLQLQREIESILTIWKP